MEKSTNFPKMSLILKSKNDIGIGLSFYSPDLKNIHPTSIKIVKLNDLYFKEIKILYQNFKSFQKFINYSGFIILQQTTQDKMQTMARMNKKLDIGWKMTNSSCEICNGVTLADPNNLTEYYCPKCDKIMQFHAEEFQEIKNNSSAKNDYDDQEEYFNQIIAQSGINMFKKPEMERIVKTEKQYTPEQIKYQFNQQRTNDVSKKLGEKLLQGWAMLQQCCFDCNVPLMKSKKGEKICFGCQKDYAKIEEEKKMKKSNPVSHNNKIQQKVQNNVKNQIPSKQIKKQQARPKMDQSRRNSQNFQTLVQNQQSSKKFVQGSNKKENVRHCCKSTMQLVDRIEAKALKFLQYKMDKAIDQNDITGVQRILSIVKGTKISQK